ncbi:YybS family protein [bacterium]|nr:YybS family protein [bacterium]
MVYSNRLNQLIVSLGAGVSAGALFTWIVGDIDAAHYVVEFLSIGPIEIPFIVLAAVLSRKYSWGMGAVYTLIGTAVSLFMAYPGFSVTSVIFLKTALMGVVLGESAWFGGRFTGRLAAVALPGFVLAVAFGFPLIAGGVPADVLDDIRNESLEMYKAFMSNDDAVNAVENALYLFKFFFRVSLGILFLGSLVVSWLSFLGARWLMVRLREEPEPVPPLYAFALPFHAVWLFILGLGLYLGEFKPLLPVALNLLFIMAFLYGIQGLAVVMHFMNRVSMGRFPRVFFWLIFFVTITFSFVILIFTGIIDNWFNLRSLPFSTQTNGEEEENKDESDS